MSYKIKYSVLRYSPSMVAGESINLGVLISEVDGEFRKFFYTSKWSRIREFDDELDIEMVKILLNSIEEEVERSLYNLNQKFNIDKFVLYYFNEYHFDAPIDISCEDIDETVDEIVKLYLRFDFDKKHRPSREEEIAFISKILKNKNVKYKRNLGIQGKFDDKIVYDYIFWDYGVKIFHLKKSSINKMMNDIKAWAWNCEKNTVIKTMIFYEYDSQDSLEDRKIVEKAVSILEDATSEVYVLEDGIARLNLLLEIQTK